MKQFVFVKGNRLMLFNKEKGRWQKKIETSCIYGKNGYSKSRCEGDLTTPKGCFPLLYAFGTEKNPGTKMKYRRITENSYFTFHNKWIESGKPIRGEHLIEYPQEYKYGIIIGFNINPYIEGKGSAIFLHCKGDKEYTSGCIAVGEDVMIYLLKNIGKESYIIIR